MCSSFLHPMHSCLDIVWCPWIMQLFHVEAYFSLTSTVFLRLPALFFGPRLPMVFLANLLSTLAKSGGVCLVSSSGQINFGTSAIVRLWSRFRTKRRGVSHAFWRVLREDFVAPCNAAEQDDHFAIRQELLMFFNLVSFSWSVGCTYSQ